MTYIIYVDGKRWPRLTFKTRKQAKEFIADQRRFDDGRDYDTYTIDRLATVVS